MSAEQRTSAEVPEKGHRATRTQAQRQRQQLLQRQLLACLRSPWMTLAVVPAQPGFSALPIAEALAGAAWLLRGRQARVFSAEGVDLASASMVIVDMNAEVANGGLSIAVIDPVVSRHAGIPVALAADAALLCVPLGATEAANAKRTVELIGPQKFIGAVTVQAGWSAP